MEEGLHSIFLSRFLLRKLNIYLRLTVSCDIVLHWDGFCVSWLVCHTCELNYDYIFTVRSKFDPLTERMELPLDRMSRTSI